MMSRSRRNETAAVPVNPKTDLPVYTIYERPRGYPGEFVVRKFVVKPPGVTFTGEVVGRSKTLAGARKLLPSGLYRLARFPHDDPVIVETWL
jgi:hypothetical protein